VIRSNIAIAFCFIASAGLSAADSPAPATIIREDGREIGNVYVYHENVDQIHWSQDQAGRSKGTFQTKDIHEVEYQSPRDVNYSKALGALRSNDLERAAAAFSNAADSAGYEWARIDALLRRSEILGRLDQTDEAVAALERVISEYPKSVETPRAMRRKGELLLADGRLDAARQAFAALEQQAGDFASFATWARVAAAYGEGRVLMAEDEQAQAIELLAEAAERLDATRFPTDYLTVIMALGQAQAESEQVDAALETYRELFYLPVPPAEQARAHLEAARLLQAKQELVAAFDRAATAAVRGAEDPGLRRAAVSLAKSLADDLDKDESIPAKQRREYRDYANRL